MVRLKQLWLEEYEAWSKRSLQEKRDVYLWVDGVYLSVRLEAARPCVLVIIGVLEDGRKELVALEDGERESEQSWYDLLGDLKNRGLSVDPEVAAGDGALGFWKALSRVFPKTCRQRCWVHKTANVLNHLPKGHQGHARRELQQIWMAATRNEAYRAFDRFLEKYQVKYPKAAQSLSKDRDALLCFCGFPAEHWVHLRTSNPIESAFATVRLRTDKTKGAGSRLAGLSMAFKRVQAGAKHWRLLHSVERIRELVAGATFKDGIKGAA